MQSIRFSLKGYSAAPAGNESHKDASSSNGIDKDPIKDSGTQQGTGTTDPKTTSSGANSESASQTTSGATATLISAQVAMLGFLVCLLM